MNEYFNRYEMVKKISKRARELELQEKNIVEMKKNPYNKVMNEKRTRKNYVAIAYEEIMGTRSGKDDLHC